MNARLHRLLLAAAIAACMLVPECMIVSSGESSTTENTPSTGGTGSEVVGVVEYPDDNGAAKTIRTGGMHVLPVVGGGVFINWRRFLPDTAGAGETPYTFTDSSGAFRIRYARPGEQMVYIRDGGGNSVARTFMVPDDGATVDLGTLRARKSAGVAVQYSGKTPGDVLFILNVLGTGMQVRCESRNLQVTLGGIPTGADQIIYVRLFKPVKKKYEFKPISLSPGAVATLKAITGD